MSKTFHIAVGGLVLLLAAILGLLSTQVPAATRGAILLRIALGVGIVGALFLARGLRSPFGARQLESVRRRFQPANIVLGPLLIAAGAGVLYLQQNVIAVLPDALAVGALVAVPLGVIVTASVYVNACAHCGTVLKGTAAPGALLRAAVFSAQPEHPGNGPGGAHGLASASQPRDETGPVAYCPRCRRVALFGPESGPIVLRDQAARRLIEKLLGEDRFGEPIPLAVDPLAAARASPSRDGGKVAPVVVLLLGISFAAFSAVELRAQLDARRGWSEWREAVEARVVVQEKTERLVGGVTLPMYRYSLRIEYRTEDGVRRTAEQDVVSWFERLDLRAQPTVRFSPADPSQVAVSTVAALRYGPLVFTGWGIVVGAVLVAAAVKMWRRALALARRGG